MTRYEEISEHARDTRLRLDINKILFFRTELIIILFFFSTFRLFGYSDVTIRYISSVFSLLEIVVYRERMCFTRTIELLSFLSTNEKLMFLFRLCSN